MRKKRQACFSLFASLLLMVGSLAASSAEPPLPDGTDEATKAMAAFKAPDGMQVELFAAEPQLGAPVAFCLDEQGRVYVAEEYRFNRGTEENRTRPFLLEDDLQIRTLDDRLAMYKKWAHKFEGGMRWFSKYSDQVRLLEDRDGDGRADHSSVFAGGFNAPLDGLAAGVIARDGDVYFTCIPNLWRLRDTDGDGVADQRKVIHTGFGVNAAFLGHDLHGLAWGPEGKLYFSVGDRGYHVTSQEGKTFSNPRRGGVFRCYPDGREFEVVHWGMRNPQELAFDQYGNLFAADNNCDKGDHSRLVYVVEGGDSGWNMAYQTIPDPYLTGPWHAEQLWHLAHAGQPAWILPPVGKLGAGPSGFAFSSGVGLAKRYRNHFYMCNYTGRGGVESFAVLPKGAAFEMVDYHDFLKPLSATDVDFGYDGKMYVSDFVKLEWNGGGGKGRIYRVFDPQAIKDPAVAQTTKIFRNGFHKLTVAELAKLLAHSDMRVRQRAQFALAGHKAKKEAYQALARTMHNSDDQLARLHGLWGLGQIAVKDRSALAEIAKLLEASDPILRGQAAKLVGDHRHQDSAGRLLELLADPSPRVKLFAAISLGKLGHRGALDAVFSMLASNNNQDAYLRHAGVMALSGIGDFDAVFARSTDENAGVRMAVLLVLRRRKDPRIAEFLKDPDILLVTEAARAINALPLDDLTPALADLIGRITLADPPVPDALARRVINANFRLGTAECAKALSVYVAQSHAPEKIRAEALAALGDWAEPPKRDRVNGNWRPLPKRDLAIIKQVMEAHIPQILAATSGKLQAQATQIVARLNLKTDDSTFFAWVPDTKRDESARIAALRLLAQRNYPRLSEAINTSLADASPRLRSAAREVLAKSDPARAKKLLVKTLESGEVIEKQLSFPVLARLGDQGSVKVLSDWLDQLIAGRVAREVQLDLLEAAQSLDQPEVKTKMEKYTKTLTLSDPLARFRIARYGGDAQRGRQLFRSHSTGQCMRCHKVGTDGGTAGPELIKTLSKIPADQLREHLLQSLIVPSAKISPGFGAVTLSLDSGKIVAGTVRSEDETKLVLLTPQNKTITVFKDEIEARTPARSPMPEMRKVLKVREMRDLIEYLATLK